MNKSNLKGRNHKKLNIYIDTENVSGKKADKIMHIIKSQYGTCDRIYMYSLQNDQGPKAWRDYINANPNLKKKCIDKRLFGNPDRDKVDKKMIKDMASCISQNTSDVIVLVSSDHGFSTIANEAQVSGHRFVGLGNQKSSKNLMRACAEFHTV